MTSKKWWVGAAQARTDGLQEDAPGRGSTGGRPRFFTKPPIEANVKYKYTSPSPFLRAIRGEPRLEPALGQGGGIRWVSCSECGFPKKIRKMDKLAKIKDFSSEITRKKHADLFEDPELYWQQQVHKSRQQSYNWQEIFDNWALGARPEPTKSKPLPWQKVPHHYRHHGVPAGTREEPANRRTSIVACSTCFNPNTLSRLDLKPHKYDPAVMEFNTECRVKPCRIPKEKNDCRLKVLSGVAAINNCGSASYLLRLHSQYTASSKRKAGSLVNLRRFSTNTLPSCLRTDCDMYVVKRGADIK